MLIQGQPEFSRPFLVDRLGSSTLSETIMATADERERLAKRLGLVLLEQLAAVVYVERRADGDIVHLSGRLEADVVQTCVVTLAEFPSHVEDSFETDFSPNAPQSSPEIVLDPDSEPPEPLIGGVIDLGELVTQYLSLALDPYPQAPGVAFDALWVADDEAMSPFAALKNLKA